jgi:DNA-binding CsgD family transcriptional regulator
MPQFVDPDHLHALVFGQAVHFGQFKDEQIAETLGLSLETVDGIREDLLTLRLLQPSPHGAATFAPVSPETAATELVRVPEDEIRSLQQEIAVTRLRLNKLLPAYVEGRRLREQVQHSLEPLEATEQIRWALKDQLARRPAEILVSCGVGLLTSRAFDGTHQGLLGAARQGTRIRALYQHASLADAAVHRQMVELAAADALVRTHAEPAGQLVVFDTEVAVVFNREPTPGTEPTGTIELPAAVAVRDATVIAHLRATFDRSWADATSSDPDDGGTSTDLGPLQLSIVRLLAQGFKDDMVARRLGMSVRTCRRHIKEIMDTLDADSRFQAGVRAALNGSATETRPQDSS